MFILNIIEISKEGPGVQEYELIELIQKIQSYQTEYQDIEVKSAHEGCPRRLYDTLSSFSNQDSGGIIVFGLEESDGFRLSDVYDLNDLQKSVTEQCLQMEPPVRAVFTFTEIDGKKAASCEVPAVDMDQRPCFYKGKGKYKGSFIRVGDADLPMSDYEIYEYEAFRKHVHDDERVIERADMGMMDKDKLESFLMDSRQDRPGFARLTEEQAYEMLGVTRGGKITLAGVMNFSLYPQGYLPQHAITAIVVPGRDLGDTGDEGERFIDNKRIEGTISEMVEGAVSFCKRNMKTKTIIDPETGKRRDEPEYPIAAVREAVLNALIHRDYSNYTEGTPVQIDMFDNRMEIHSPGGLYGRVRIEDLGIARPDLRNPTLATMTESQTEAENRYSGIPTMRREMALRGLPEPLFENRRDEFVVTLFNEKNTPGRMNTGIREEGKLDYYGKDRDDALLRFCSIPRTRKEIADYLGIRTIFYVTAKYIDPLIEQGKLAMEKPDRPKSKNQRYYSSEDK